MLFLLTYGTVIPYFDLKQGRLICFGGEVNSVNQGHLQISFKREPQTLVE